MFRCGFAIPRYLIIANAKDTPGDMQLLAPRNMSTV